MDKIKIEFSNSNFEYCYRIPKNFSWFEMSRFIKESSYKLCEHIIYNEGKLFFDKWILVDREKVEFNMSYDEQSNLKKIFLKKLIEHEGITPVTCAFAKSLKVKIEEAMYAVDIETNLYKNKTMYFDNPYDILGIKEDEYTKEELLKIVESRINKILDAYNSIVKQKLLKNK